MFDQNFVCRHCSRRMARKEESCCSYAAVSVLSSFLVRRAVLCDQAKLDIDVIITII